MKCKNHRIRTKKGVKYGYCIKFKKEVSFSCYKECNKKEYKEYKKLQPKTEYKYKIKKGKCNKYYNNISIMPKSNMYSTTKIKGYEKHHIFGGVANRPKSEKYGMFVWLSEEQHRYITEHPLVNLKLKKIAQATFMEFYGKNVDEFIEIFGRSYI